MANSYVFYRVANLYEFIQPHSYDFVQLLWGVSLGVGLGVVIHTISYEFATS